MYMTMDDCTSYRSIRQRMLTYADVVSLAVVLSDARTAALLALASLAVVLADARPAALLALASLAVVLALYFAFFE